MQDRGSTLAPGFIFDSDMGRNIDAAFGLSMLYGLGRGRLIAVGISNPSLDAALFTETIARFYNAGAGGVLPIGLAEDGPKVDDAPMLTAPLAMRNADGQPTFRRGIRDIGDTADPAVVFRNGLLTQQDKQAIVILAGPDTNLARLLVLPRARDIVAAKVRLLVIAAGMFNDGAADIRIRADISSARRVFADWPSPIVSVGLEAANITPFPDRSIETDFSVLANHPVVPAYRAYREKQDARPGDLAVPGVLAVLYATNPDANYFKLSSPGVITVSDDGRARFAESANGTRRYLVIDAAHKETITQAFIAMATVKAPTGRGTPPREF